MHFNWTYVIIVQKDEEYQRGLSKNLRARLSTKNICIAYIATFDELADKKLLQARILHHSKKAKAVINLTGYKTDRLLDYPFLEALAREDVVHLFTDITIKPPDFSRNASFGSLFVAFSRYTNPDFINWYNQLKHSEMKNLPYGPDIWREIFGEKKGANMSLGQVRTFFAQKRSQYFGIKKYMQ